MWLSTANHSAFFLQSVDMLKFVFKTLAPELALSPSPVEGE